jgi:F-type H+-transporting ATPase subunit delta
VIADRYAQALVGMISDLKELDRIDAELTLFSNLFKTDDRFRRFFLSPRVLTEKKKEFIRLIFKDQFSKEVINLILLIIDKHRENLALDITQRFDNLADEVRGVESGTVITAVPLHKDDFTLLEDRIQIFSKRRITLVQKVDPSIIGGVVLWLGNHVVDGSIRYRLEMVRRDLLALKSHMTQT